MAAEIERCLDLALAYGQGQDWKGYDPFDGLNSRLFKKIPFLSSRPAARLLFLQANKRLPLNLRPWLGVPKERNPKGIGLLLRALLSLYGRNRDGERLRQAEELASWLKRNACPGYSGKCWGYNFDWQSRAFFIPRGTPTVVNTSFIGRAFVQAHDLLGRPALLDVARSACEFIVRDLHRTGSNGAVGFSYTPLDFYFVNNATALAGSLLSLVYARTREAELAEFAKRAMAHVIANQRRDGSWNYGENEIARGVGIDSFHTGFILESLGLYAEAVGDPEYVPHLKTGLDFYQRSFFLKDGSPKYYRRQARPFDIHSASQAVITLLRLRDFGSDLGLCRKVRQWMIDHLWDDEGYFYYQKRRFLTVKIPYMRWAQAWGVCALAEYLSQVPAGTEER